MTNRSKKLGLVVPTPEEDAAINAGIAADPDTRELTAPDLARMQPLRRPGGRPRLAHPKVPVTMRMDGDVLDAIKASGVGWQTRVNQVLRDAVRRGRLSV